MVHEITDEELARAAQHIAENSKSGYEDDELLEYIDQLQDELGKFPRPKHIREREDGYAVPTYYNHFGNSWRNVKDEYKKWKTTQ